jgi:5'-nucleotidase
MAIVSEGQDPAGVDASPDDATGELEAPPAVRADPGSGTDALEAPPAARAGRGAPVDALSGDHPQPAPLAERTFPSARATPRSARPLSEWQTRPRILVTNDDGIESRGLLMLKQALEPIGDVYVLAPETNQSAVGHSMTFMRPLRVRQRVLDDGSMGWSVDGSPTDAVGLAFLGYFGVGFDLVASGINYGVNLGDDITYSGTVGAAMEAVLSGCPAFAISQEFEGETDFELARRVAGLVARNILEHGLGAGELLNVNVPSAPVEDFGGIELTRMGKRVYQDQLVERLDPRGTPYYWFGGPPPTGLAEPGTDFHAVLGGRVAITPIQLDLTARRLLERIGGWDWELDDEAVEGNVGLASASHSGPP